LESDVGATGRWLRSQELAVFRAGGVLALEHWQREQMAHRHFLSGQRSARNRVMRWKRLLEQRSGFLVAYDELNDRAAEALRMLSYRWRGKVF
jgi:hypothetical protein